MFVFFSLSRDKVKNMHIALLREAHLRIFSQGSLGKTDRASIRAGSRRDRSLKATKKTTKMTVSDHLVQLAQ